MVKFYRSVRIVEKQAVIVLVEASEKISIEKRSLKRTRKRIGKIDLLRTDLREYMESNLKRIYEEIAEIKNALRKAGIM